MATKKKSIPISGAKLLWDQARVVGGLEPEVPAEETAPEPSGVMRRVAGDTGLSLLKGAIAVPEAAVGVADLVTGGHAGRMAEAAGFRPAEAKAILDKLYTPEQQAANAQVQGAEGVMGKLAAAVQNPSVIGHTVAESVPGMLAGGVVARGAMAAAPRMGAIAAGAIGEGTVSAGLTAEQIRQQTEDGLLTGKQSLLAGTSGVATGVLGVLGGKVAQKLGIGDLDTMLAQASRATGAQAVAANQVQKGLVRRVLEGAVAEGVLEELPQSVQEQVLQNAALGKPLDEGVDYAAVMGLLSGVVMGGGAAGIGQPGAVEPAIMPPTPPAPPPGDQLRKDKVPEVGPMTRALNTAIETAAQKADAGVPIPADPAAPANPTASPAEGTAKTDERGVLSVLAVPQEGGAPEIDFEAVLARMHAEAADELANIRVAGIADEARNPPAVQPAGPAVVQSAPKPEPQPAPMGDVLNPQGKPFANRSAAAAARARQADPGAFNVVQVDGGFVVRPTSGWTTDGEQAGADVPAGTADGAGVPGDPGLAQRVPDAAGVQGDADAPVGGGEASQPAVGVRPGGDEPAAELSGQQVAAAPVAPAKGDGVSGGEAPPAAAAPRTVQVNEQTVTLTAEQAAQWAEADRLAEEERRQAREKAARASKAGSPADPDVGYRNPREQLAAELKAIGMRLSARRREIAGVQTPKEQAKATEEAGRLRSGDNVEFDADGGTRRGTVSGTAFGKVRVRAADGTTRTVPRAQVRKVDAAATAPQPAADAGTAAAPVAAAPETQAAGSGQPAQQQAAPTPEENDETRRIDMQIAAIDQLIACLRS